ncbi:hypothetical protein PLICRDRAFT_176522 [Plicaturopsis crispa FD-325 SS-3]|nr:hypothetical protein PLICRDRAFT_176522 [Plicaturopsis crispa FD-325 SS-3]
MAPKRPHDDSLLIHGSSGRAITRSRTSERFRAQKIKVQQARKEFIAEMLHAWVGPMPVEDFLHDFLPAAKGPCAYVKKPSTWKRIWNRVKVGCKGTKKQTGMYPQIINAIKESRVCPTMTFLDSHSKADPAPEDELSHRLRPDICAYKKTANIPEGNPTQWSFMELWIEVQSTDNETDPWCDPPPSAAGSQTTESDFLPSAEERVDARGQHIMYSSELLNRQHRNFAFSVTICGNCARLIRWDRAGAIVSSKFNYKQTQYLGEFFWRFSHMSDAQRGIDTTVRQASDHDKVLAREHLSDHNDDRYPILNVTGPEKRRYIIWGPLSGPLSSIGRATRAYPALDAETKELVILKDVWRVDHEDWPQEGQILSELNNANVSYIPKLHHNGHRDVDSVLGKTQTNLYGTFAWVCSRPLDLTPRKHYRMVTSFSGFNLRHFRDSRDLMVATHHAYICQNWI